jgi:regulator of sigma E protease
MVAFLENARNIALLAVGFGFVVFWHELGHFLAAKWAGVKVEQFAVGFGQAVFSWRKGVGFRSGSTQKEFRKRIEARLDAGGVNSAGSVPAVEKSAVESADEGPTDLQVAKAAEELGLGETEYRLNWIPLGGYVKMLGQDDMKPNSDADDPRAFNRQSIGKRMVIVSAGVVMNVILAAIGFMVLFLMGFNVTPATVGAVLPGSPAQVAKLLPGDVILTINGREQNNEWTKVQLNAALSGSNEKTQLTVERIVNGKKEIVPLEIEAKRSALAKEFLGFGIMPAQSLKAPTAKELKDAGEADLDDKTLAMMLAPDMRALKPGDEIVAVDGTPVDPDDNRSFLVLDQALQQSNGKPVPVTVAADEGKGPRRSLMVPPHFMDPFGEDSLNFAGMIPRVEVAQVPKDSQSFGVLLPGDVITHVSSNAGGASAVLDDPSIKAFRQRMNDAGRADSDISVKVLRDGTVKTFDHLHARKIDADNYGLKIGVDYDENNPVVADVMPGSAAQKANIPAQATLLKIGGDAVSSWFDVQTAMKKWTDAHPGAAPMPLLPVTYKTAGGQEAQASLELGADEVAAIASYHYKQDLELDSQHVIRHTSSPITAAEWGIVETRDFIMQFYLTLNRMRSGDVSPKNMMGPLGIFQAGTGFAAKGNDWLIWFLSMISANLAVVNFLPIPIVDGGLFTFLILEKLKGRPLSPKTQAIAQYVGMALLLGIVLFVTWQDVANFSFRTMH